MRRAPSDELVEDAQRRTGIVERGRAHTDRARPGEDPRDYAMGLAKKKALDVAAKVPAGLVLGADTIVY